MIKHLKLCNLKWVVSAAAYVVLMAVANIHGLLIAAVCVFAVAIVSMFLPDMSQHFRKKNRRYDIYAVLIDVVAGLNFYTMWKPSSMMESIAQKMGLTRNVFLGIVAISGVAIAFYSLRCCISAMAEVGKRKAKRKIVSLHDRGYRVGKKEYVFLLFVAVIVITICSKSSPIYPLNDWVDSNCFFTVGKSMLHGKVLYRDIFEQKGFYLYVLHALAYLISNTSFLGVYLFEIAAAYAFLWLAYRISLLYCSDSRVIWLIPIVAAMVYGTSAFSHGDSAEEFCLPFLVYALWVGMKTQIYQKQPTKKECLIIGITSGCVLWIKYTMLGFYLGWFAVVVFAMLREKEYKSILILIERITTGVCIATVPVLLYFLYHGALTDLWEVYFYNNIFLYSRSAEAQHAYGILGNIIFGTYNALQNNRELSILIFMSLCGFGLLGKKRTVVLLIVCLMTTAMLTFLGNGQPIYYALVLAAFAPTALPVCGRFVSRYSNKTWNYTRYLFGIGGMMLALLLNNNAYMLRYTEQDLPQFAFKEIVDRVENPTLLNYGFLDGGFYTVYDIVPHCKYFCKTNIALSEMIETQEYYVENGLSDFVVTRGKQIDNELYECVAEGKYFFEKDFVYRLYALKSLNLQQTICLWRETQ